MMALFLLSGHAAASEAVRRARMEREMAELLRLRIDLVALEYEDYRDKATEGDFPARVSTRILDEEKVLGDRFEGYRWEATVTETVGAGAAGQVEVGTDVLDLLFGEEGDVSAPTDATEEERTRRTEEEAETKEPEEVDRMLLIEVTVYPPGYDEATEEEREGILRPRKAWTAVYVPPEEAEEPPR
jgi:hypothetical protein